jgi:hypothetical protein
MGCEDRYEENGFAFCGLTGSRCSDENMKACEEYIMTNKSNNGAEVT